MKIFYFFLAIMFAHRCAAQTDTLVNTMPADSVAAKASLTLAAVYANNANYYGQKALEKIPYAALAANYKLKCGLYFTGLAYRLLHDSSHTVSAGSAGAGFALKINKQFSGDISYSHSFYAGLSPLLQASNTENASASLQYENFITTKLNADYAFGTSSDVFVTLGIAKQITLAHISNKDLITITPSVDAVAGTQHFYQTYITREKLRDSVLGIIFSPLIGQPQTGSSTKTTSTSTQINLLSYNFKCPLDYTRAHYMLEIACQLSMLSNKAQSNPGKLNTFLTAGFYYQF